LLNDNIKAQEILVIDDKGEKLGAISKQEALDLAKAKGLDLYLVSPNSNPPVGKIVDYGHLRYEKEKKLKEAKRSSKHGNVKKVLKFSLRIGDHDYNVRKSHGKKFLEKGYRVQAIVIFRGREMTHRNLGEAMLARFIKDMAEYGSVETQSKGDRDVSAIIVPLK